MAAYDPITVSAEKAARFPDLKPAEFLAAVESGHLPDGKEIIPGKKRWPVDVLRAVVKADAVLPQEDFDI